MPLPDKLPSWVIAATLVLAIGLSLAAHAQQTLPSPEPATAPAPAPVSAAELPSVTLPPALDAVLRDYERAFRARDAHALAALFTQDGFALPEGRPPMRGRAVLNDAFRHVGGPLSLRAVAYREQADLATVIGAYRFNNDGSGRDDGKFVLTLVREAGSWRIFSDMDNGNAPPRPPSRPSTRPQP